MAYEQKEGKGSLFVNKKTKETQPDYKGTLKVNGQELKISGWLKTTATGLEIISLSVDQGWSGSGQLPRVSDVSNLPDNDMPF